MKFFEKGELATFWPFYGEAFIGTILFIYLPFLVVYFNSLGFSATQVGILVSIAPLISIVFEIPTGAIADIYGRKFSVMLGWVLVTLSVFLFYFFTQFYVICFLTIIFGIAFTFTSGSYDAWVVDLAKHKKLDLRTTYFAKRISLLNLGFIFSGVVGALCVAHFGIRSIWIVTGFAGIVTLFFFSFGEEYYKKRKVSLKDSFKELLIQTKNSFSYAYNHHTLFYLFLISAFSGLLLSVNQIAVPLLLKSLGFADSNFGYLWSLVAIVGVIMPLVALRFSKIHSSKKMLIASSIILFIVCMVLFSFTVSIILLVIFSLLWRLLRDFQAPLTLSLSQEYFPTKLRATLGSTENMIFSLTYGLGMIFSGAIIDFIGAKYTLIGSFFLFIPIVIFLFKINGE